ncbi:MAG TPA: sensor histidine kinase, partial [Devosia sp.]|nr:sensor histidine kinase [Devosia sp.]
MSSVAEQDQNQSISKKPRDPNRAVFDARQRLTSTTGTRASYDVEMMRAYANSRKSSALSMTILLLILGAFASFWVPIYAAIIWSILVIAANQSVVFICSRFLKEQKSSTMVGRWTASFIAAETIYGITWAMVAFFTLTTGGEEIAVVMFAMLIMGIGANAMASRALPYATLMNTLPATLTVSINLITLGLPLYYSLAAVACIAQVFFLVFLKRLQKMELTSLAHQSDRDALILDLEDARQFSDQARREAEQASIAKSNFLATMSHELRTPLNAIIGFSEVLKSELLGPHGVPQYKEYANDIHSSGQHLLNLINELLDLSRIEAGKYELNEEVVSLADVADDCLRMMKIRARAKDIEFVEIIDEELPKIWGDERAIRQIMLNLL